MQEYLLILQRQSIFSKNITEPALVPTALHTVEQAILQHLDNPEFRIVELAQIAGYSQRNLNRLVREKSGMTPVQLVRTLRVEKAKALLIHTDKTIAEIAYETGFTEPSYFTKIFTRMHDSSPTQWRKSAAI